MGAACELGGDRSSLLRPRPGRHLGAQVPKDRRQRRLLAAEAWSHASCQPLRPWAGRGSRVLPGMKREANLDPPAHATQRLGNFRDREQRVRAFFVCEDKEKTRGLWIYSLKLLQLPSFFQLSQNHLTSLQGFYPGIPVSLRAL